MKRQSSRTVIVSGDKVISAFRFWYCSMVMMKRNNYRINYTYSSEIVRPPPLRNLGTKIGIQCIQAKKIIAYSHTYTLNRYIVHEHQNVIRRRKRDCLSRRNNSHTVSEIAKSTSTFDILAIFLPHFSLIELLLKLKYAS